MTDDRRLLDLEIARLRRQLDDAEQMRQAIANEEIDAFVVGRADVARIVMLDGAATASAALLELMPQGAVTVSCRGEILYANQRFATMVGKALTELFATGLPELVDQRDRMRLHEFLADGAQAGSIELRLQPGTRQVRIAAASRSDGYVSLLVTDDATDAQGEQAEHALQAIRDDQIDGFVVGGDRVMLLGEAYRPYRAIVDGMLQGAATVSDDGDVLYANERFATMVAASRESLLGRSVFGYFQGDDLAVVRRLLRAGRLDAPCELTIVARDGSSFPVHVDMLSHDDAGGVTLVLTDLSENRRVRQIEEEGRRKDQFLAELAHELRNPLAAIRNSVEVLEHLVEELPGRARTSVAIVGRQTATLARLVEDLIDVQRLNEGKIVLRRQRCDAAAVIRSAVEAAQPYLEERRHVLEVSLPDEPVVIDVDAVRMTQVLLNVLTNAAKYTGTGGHVRLALTALARNAAAPALARIEVTDDGIGVEADELEKIFEPYVQLQSHAEQQGGLGLGLAVSRRLLELHGGAIRARSDGPGRGCVFTLELPACAAPLEQGQAPITALSSPRDGRRILVADDNKDAVESMAALLQLMGHQTRVAKDGVEAVEIAEEFRPDIAFLDIGMPRMDGYAAARALRRRAWSESLVLCALTGWGQPSDRNLAREAGFDSHYVKPIDPEILLRAINMRRPVSRNR